MKYNTQNAKIDAVTEKTLVIGIDVGSEIHYARAFDCPYLWVYFDKHFWEKDCHSGKYGEQELRSHSI